MSSNVFREQVKFEIHTRARCDRLQARDLMGVRNDPDHDGTVIQLSNCQTDPIYTDRSLVDDEVGELSGQRDLKPMVLPT